MSEKQAKEWDIIRIIDDPKAVLDLCDSLGSSGYFLEGKDRLRLIVPTADAGQIMAHVSVRTSILRSGIRVRNLPKGIRQLTRGIPTASIGAIDEWESGGEILGWFHPDQLPEGKIQVFSGQKLLVETEANIFRPDLFEAGVADGVAGFVCSCPAIEEGGPEVTLRNSAQKVLRTIASPKRTIASMQSQQVRSSDIAPPIAVDLPEPNASGQYRTALGEFSLDYYVSTGTANRMIVFSPGFLDTNRFPYPYFQRMKWAQNFNETCVFLADPSLLLGSTQIGWFIGDKRVHYLPIVAEFIRKLAQSRSIPSENVTFFGSSAGGFSSIGFAAHLRGACAIAVNPQTNGLRLHSPSQLAATLRSCLGVTDLGEAKHMYAERFILSEMFRQVGNVPRIKIWQNFYDRYHVEHHLLPFLDEIKDLSPTAAIEVHMPARPEDGHDPPDLSVIRHLFEN
ncbi:MAG: hypothetical protein MEQ74_12240 [Paracoccus sp.]|nr:hypothetical protein [Paracoccus sp. (in: a-proteobacteria)]